MKNGPSPGLIQADNVLDDLLEWTAQGLSTALVTLVGVEGPAPRPLGAQMAVAADGRFSGYLSGGCIEEAVAREALQAMADGRNRLTRYGKGSAYFDLKLPCGSGLDLYIDQSLGHGLLERARALRGSRTPFTLVTNLSAEASHITDLEPGQPLGLRQEDLFHRAYSPPLRALLVGGGPSVAAIARLLSATGIETRIVTPDDAARRELTAAGILTEALHSAEALDVTGLDAWTAAIVAFHEHEWEAPCLAKILPKPCFYVGVMGSRAAHASRLDELQRLGVDAEAISRLRCPIGSIPGAKSRATLAVGILAEVMAEAKAAQIIP